ncbi:hypothetical protein QU593_10290 [Rossellomorea marisflavi]|uniref:hypothetical protein n=1 Tax=Rossellomorea marisflavi TaxID=189381 RepID=UPI0025B0CA07|nr:hypothetical protein [Rossellomorea marisflavi]WJV20794.1 hypothetical protein QU593_10290 [Rossellomorea marisflavi]
MCIHGSFKMVRLNNPRESGRTEVPVDECIADEIQMLNDVGVVTYGSCCGHFEDNSSCLVDVSSKDALEIMGYVLSEYSSEHSKQGVYEINIGRKINI